jgi:hypothetical protein
LETWKEPIDHIFTTLKNYLTTEETVVRDAATKSFKNIMESALKNPDIKKRAETAVSIFTAEPLKITDSRFVEPKKHKALSDPYLC